MQKPIFKEHIRNLSKYLCVFLVKMVRVRLLVSNKPLNIIMFIIHFIYIKLSYATRKTSDPLNILMSHVPFNLLIVISIRENNYLGDLEIVPTAT